MDTPKITIETGQPKEELEAEPYMNPAYRMLRGSAPGTAPERYRRKIERARFEAFGLLIGESCACGLASIGFYYSAEKKEVKALCGQCAHTIQRERGFVLVAVRPY